MTDINHIPEDDKISFDEGTEIASNGDEVSIDLILEVDDDWVQAPTLAHLKKLEAQGAQVLFIHRVHETLFGPRKFTLIEDDKIMKVVGVDEDPQTATSSGDYLVEDIIANYYVTDDSKESYDDFLRQVRFYTMSDQ